MGNSRVSEGVGVALFLVLIAVLTGAGIAKAGWRSGFADGRCEAQCGDAAYVRRGDVCGCVDGAADDR